MCSQKLPQSVGHIANWHGCGEATFTYVYICVFTCTHTLFIYFDALDDLCVVYNYPFTSILFRDVHVNVHNWNVQAQNEYYFMYAGFSHSLVNVVLCSLLFCSEFRCLFLTLWLMLWVLCLWWIWQIFSHTNGFPKMFRTNLQIGWNKKSNVVITWKKEGTNVLDNTKIGIRLRVILVGWN